MRRFDGWPDAISIPFPRRLSRMNSGDAMYGSLYQVESKVASTPLYCCSSPLLPVPPPLTSFLPPQLHQADRYRVNKYVSVCSSKLRPSEKFLTKTWHPSLPFLQNTPLRKALLMICTPKSSKFLFVEIIEKRTGTKTHRKSNLLSNWLGTVFIFFSKIDLNRSVSNWLTYFILGEMDWSFLTSLWIPPSPWLPCLPPPFLPNLFYYIPCQIGLGFLNLICYWKKKVIDPVNFGSKWAAEV